MIKTDRDIWEDCTLETLQNSCEHCNPYPIRYFNKEKNKEWVSIDDLMKVMAFVNKKLYDDEFGSYDWNELLLEFLENGVDER